MSFGYLRHSPSHPFPHKPDSHQSLIPKGPSLTHSSAYIRTGSYFPIPHIPQLPFSNLLLFSDSISPLAVIKACYSTWSVYSCPTQLLLQSLWWSFRNPIPHAIFMFRTLLHSMMHLGLAQIPNTIYKALVCQPHLIPHHPEQHNIPSTDFFKSCLLQSINTGYYSPASTYSIRPYKTLSSSQSWHLIPAIPVQRRLKQEDCCKFRTSLSYTVSLKPTRTT